MIKTSLPLLVRSYIIVFTGVHLVLAPLAGASTATGHNGGIPKHIRPPLSDTAVTSPKPVKKTVIIGDGDTLADILTREGVSLGDALFVAKKAGSAYKLDRMRPGQVLELYLTPDMAGLQEVDFKASDSHRIVLYKSRVINLKRVASQTETPSVAKTNATADPSAHGPLIRTCTIAQGDTLAGILAREGVAVKDALAVAKKAQKAFALNNLRPGDDLVLHCTPNGALLTRLEYRTGKKSIVLYTGKAVPRNSPEGQPATLSTTTGGDRSDPPVMAPVETSRTSPRAAATIKLVASYDPYPLERRHPMQVSYELLAKGMVLSPIEFPWAPPIQGPAKRTATLHVHKKSVFRHAARTREEGFLTAPLRYRYVSSGFSSHRVHPVTNEIRPHYGVDFAASYGTPVHAVGSGRVVFMGWDGGFGKVIRLRHANGYVTHYGHLSRYAKGIRIGSEIKRGQVIGYVGMTGIATGPHLDFRVTYGGQFINPLNLQKHQKKITGAFAKRRRG